MIGAASNRQLIGIDVGGTFTDFVWLVNGQLRVHKAATTPHDQSLAIVKGLDELGVEPDAQVMHGTTVATNALLERRGARTALLTTQGFRDVLAIGRQNRPHLYRLSQSRPPPLVPAELRFEVPERLAADGRVLEQLDLAAVRELAIRLRDTGAESLAIIFLFSYLRPDHERVAAQILSDVLPALPLSISSAILPEHREFERTATTVINAYVRPLVARYLERLDRAVGKRSVRVMQSSGGIIGIRRAAEQAARLVLSGPAGGVVGAFALSRLALDGEPPRLITFDMGGTSTDVALCPGSIPRTGESSIAGLPMRLPSVDIHTVGAGGGSIARIDAGGVLHVGPESAGAEPGPACYSRGGTQPTVSDANLVLGRLDPRHFLAGSDKLRLHPEAARAALQRLGSRLGLSPEAAATAVIRVANAAMERALRRVSVERGHDPRDYLLVPFGGAGPLHACDLAEALGIKRVLIPPTPGVLSALGLTMADVAYDSSLAVLRNMEALKANPAALQVHADDLATEVSEVLAGEGGDASLEAFLDLRYVGQSYELELPMQLPVTAEHLCAAAQAFHAAHADRYGHALEGESVEAVNLRLRGSITGAQPQLPKDPETTSPIDVALVGKRDVWFNGAPVETLCYDRSTLLHGHRFEGPALVFQYDTTTVIPPRWRARVDAFRNIILEIGK